MSSADNLAPILAAPPGALAVAEFRLGRYFIAGRGAVAYGDLCSFTRASTATYNTAAPLLAVAAIDAPLFDHNETTGAALGLRLMEQRSQQFVSTSDLSTPSWARTACPVTNGYAIGPDGLMSARRLVPTGSGTHFIGQSQSFVNFQTYYLQGYAKASGYGFMRVSFPSSAFADDRRVATIDLTTGAVNAQDGILQAVTLGPQGFWKFKVGAVAASTTTGAPALGVNTTNSTTLSSFTANGSGILLGPVGLVSTIPNILIPDSIPQAALASVREADTMALNMPDGLYQLRLLCDDGATTVIDGVIAASGAGVIIPTPLPNGARCVDTAWVYSARQCGPAYVAQITNDDPPTPYVSLRSTDGVSLDTSGNVQAWSSAGRAAGFAVQSTAGSRPPITTVNGVPLLRPTAGKWMTLSNYSLASPGSVTAAVAFRPVGSGAMTMLGCQNVANALALKYGATAGCVQASMTTGYPLVLSQPIPDDGGLICMMFTMTPENYFRALDLNGTLAVDLGQPAGAAPIKAQGAPTLFRAAAGSEEFDGYFGEIAIWPAMTRAQREREMREMQARWADVVVPSASQTFSYAATTSSFRVKSLNVTATTSARLIVATDQGLTARIFTGAPVAPTTQVGVARTYQALDAPASGLGAYAGQRVYYAWELDGVVDLAKVQSLPLFPAIGDFDKAHLSCLKFTPGTNTVILQKVAELRPHVVLIDGDVIYTNEQRANPGFLIDTYIRTWLENATAQALAAVVSFAFGSDDHDMTPNNFAENKQYGAVSGETLKANALAAYQQMAPHYPFWDSEVRCLAYDYREVNQAVFVLDSRFQRNTATKTVFGDPTKNAGDYDQIAKCLDRMAEVNADPTITGLTIHIPSGVPFPGDEAVVDIAPHELTRIYDAAEQMDIPVDIRTGDYHSAFQDDGRGTDMSTGASCTIPSSASSPGFHDVIAADYVARWNGADTLTQDKARLFHLIRRKPDSSFTTTEWVRTSTSPIAMVIKQVRSTEDRGSTVAPAVTSLYPGQRLKLEKTWQSRTAITVDWSFNGASGTATWKPNARYFVLPEGPTTPGAYPLVLSNPVGCTLPATTIPITVAVPAGLTTYLAQADTPPPAPWLEIYTALYYGLTDAGLIGGLDLLPLFCGHESKLSRVNMANPTGPIYTAVGTGLTHQPGAGWTSNGAAYFTTGYDPGAGGKNLTRNSASFGRYQSTTTTSQAWGMGNSQFALNGRNGSDGLCYIRSSSAANRTAAMSSAIGFRGSTRTSKLWANLSANDQVYCFSEQGSAVLISEPWLSFTRAGDTGRILPAMAAYEFAGRGLANPQMIALRDLMETFRLAAAALA